MITTIVLDSGLNDRNIKTPPMGIFLFNQQHISYSEKNSEFSQQENPFHLLIFFKKKPAILPLRRKPPQKNTILKLRLSRVHNCMSTVSNVYTN